MKFSNHTEEIISCDLPKILAASDGPLIEQANVSCEIVFAESERRADINAYTTDVKE